MADYIDREAALAQCKRHYDYTAWSIADGIEAIPASDVAPVRHGRWECRKIISGKLPMYVKCSACGGVSAAYRSQWEGLLGVWNYCPNCGARMDLDGGANDDES